MPATNYTPIQLYRTATATGTAPVAGNLNFGELAINYNDGGMLLYAKNASGTIIKLMNNPANLLYPRSDGTSGQAVVTNGSGTLSFATISTAAATPTARGTLYGSDTSGSPFTTAVGYNAGAVATGVNNTFIGFEAGNDNTAGTNNTAVGYQALDVNTTGANNTALGSGALTANTTGNNNVAVGYLSLKTNSTGSSNVAIGEEALTANTTGNNNVAVGYLSGYTNATGLRNTFLGDQAGKASTGNNNTFLGARAGFASTGVNNAFIGAYNDSTGGSGYEMTTGSKNTIIGSYTGNQDGLDIRTASNYAVISDGDGNRLLSTANGYSLALDGGAVPQSGTGITFPATQSASSDANTLDDYEEGSWTVTATPQTSGSITLSSNTGYYTKVGRLVVASAKLTVSAVSSPTGLIKISLPFTIKTASGSTNVIMENTGNSTVVTDFWSILPVNDTGIGMYLSAATNPSATSAQQVTSTSTFWFTATYFTD